MKLVEAVAAAFVLVLLVSALCTPAKEILRLKKAASAERRELYAMREAGVKAAVQTRRDSSFMEGGYVAE